MQTNNVITQVFLFLQAKTAYIIFSSSMRAKVKEENPDIDAKEIVSKLAEMWKALSEEEKIEWNEKADEDKKR